MPKIQPVPPTENFWQPELEQLFATMGVDAAGLSDAEAARRLAAHGPNVLHSRRQRAVVREFLSRFRNPLVLVLLGASLIAAFLGDVRSFIVISIIVVMSVVLDFVQEFRAGRAAEQLRSVVAVQAAVVRGGVVRDLPTLDLVVGDIVQLAAGSLIPADGRIVEARDFFVNQAMLTGESYPVEKRAVAAVGVTEISAAANVVLMGTSAVSGSARMVVVRTGQHTAVAAIADTLALRPPPTAFERGTQAFGALILRLTVLLVLFVLLVNAAFHRPLFESLLFAVALAVGLTPELLPMVVSVTLARGAMRLTRQRVIVKRLSAVQDLGAMDVLCTDKTGTLTEGHIRLERIVDAQGEPSAKVLELAYLNSHFETGIESPLDEAILGHGELDVSAWRKLDEVPFDFERRRVSVLVERAGARILVLKGAPDDVLGHCASVAAAGGAAPSALDSAARAGLATLRDSFERDGFRVLGVAWRAVAHDHDHANLADEEALIFAGFAAFLDPPKASAATALAALAAGGVALKVVTGDSELVTRHVCGELQLPIAGALDGAAIARLDDQALRVQAERCNLFCRVTPVQKTRILQALRASGHVVGFLGDGINDAPSLHTADVGISVEGAVDVAKEAADMILLDQDLNVLQQGVREGRRTFANIMKYIMMGTSSNFGNMFSMAGATLLLPFLPMLPIQILLNNFLYDLSEIAIPFDEVEEEMLARPRAWDMRFVQHYMLALGPVSSLFDFITFFILLKVFAAGEVLFHTGWFIESLASQVLVIFIIRTRGSPFARRPHGWLVALAVLVVAVGALLPLTPVGDYLGFTPPAARLYLALSVVVAIYLVLMQFAKRAFYRHWERADARRTP